MVGCRKGSFVKKYTLRHLFANADTLVERNHRILSHSAASKRDVESLQNWVKGTSSLARDETIFLSHQNDLIKLVEPTDEAISSLEPVIEDAVRRVLRWTRQVLLYRLYIITIQENC